MRAHARAHRTHCARREAASHSRPTTRERQRVRAQAVVVGGRPSPAYFAAAGEGGFTPRRRHAGPAALSERHERRPRSKDRNTNRWSKDGSRLPERERQDGPGGATSTTTGMGQPKMPRGAAAGGAAAGAEERRATPPRRQQVQRHRQTGEDNDNATYAHSACKRTTSGHGRTSEGRGHGTRPSPPARGGRTTKRERQRQRAVRRQRS